MPLFSPDCVAISSTGRVIGAIADALDEAADDASEAGRPELAERHRTAALEVRFRV